jgi:hypothetical protein
MNPKRSDNVGVLFRLTTPYKWALEVVGVNDENRVVGLSSTCYHVWNEVSVTGRIQKCNLFTTYLQFLDAYVNGDTSDSFLLSRIRDPCMFECLHSHLLGLLLVSVQLFFAQELCLFQKHPNKRWFSRINMPHNNYVDSVRWCYMLGLGDWWILFIVVVCGDVLDDIRIFPYISQLI